MAKATYLALGQAHRRALSFSQLRASVCRHLATQERTWTLEEDAKLIRLLIASFVNGIVELHTHPFTVCDHISEKPIASALARMQAESGETVVSTNLQPYRLPAGFMRVLVPLLDGTRDFQGLLLDVSARCGEGVSPENLRKALDTLLWHNILAA